MNHNESKIQREIVKYIRYLYPKSILFAVPNGGQRSIITAANLKHEGVMAGVSDLIWLHKGVTYFFEIKTYKGYQSINQKYFQGLVECQGFVYNILRSTQDFDVFIQNNNLSDPKSSPIRKS